MSRATVNPGSVAPSSQLELSGSGLYRDIIGWDVLTWSKALNFWEARTKLDPPLSCLEVGARHGGLTLWFALRGNSVVCSDLSESETLARPLLARYGVLDRVRFHDLDVRELPYENSFDVIAMKSLLVSIATDGTMRHQRSAIASIFRALRPGGKFLFAENIAGSPAHSFLRRKFLPWGKKHYPTLGELRNLLGSFSTVEYATTGVLAAFGRSESQRSMLALADRVLVNHVVPEGWHYLAYGVATK